MTSDSQTLSGCITKTMEGNWLTNSHLETCILKLVRPTENEWKNDASRPGNLTIVTQLLSTNEGLQQSLLAQEFPDKPALVLASELAFGSPDFELLDALVKQYDQNLIFICGFGFSVGNNLNNIASRTDVEGVWHTPPNTNKKYNGGWVWIKQGNTTKCYVFLKNFPEQDKETSIPNWSGGDRILRLEGNDLVIFPLICADLISKEQTSPCVRIAESLSTDGSTNKRILVTSSLLNEKSESGHWKAAIGDLLEAVKKSNARLLLSNCINPVPVQDEDIDKWRCLSGAYQHREGCKPPHYALPNIRYVEDTKFSGLVLRNSEIGATFGILQWTNNSSQGLHALSRCAQHVWIHDKFHLSDGNCAADELYRFIRRNKGQILHSKIICNNAAKAISTSEFDKFLVDLSPASNSPLRAVSSKLFQKCLKGIQKEAQLCPDKLHHQAM